jgi:hypothetical protein
MAYSAIGNFQPNLGMVPEMGMYYGVQSAPIPIPQMSQHYSIPSFQQVVNYPMQQTYQPPMQMPQYHTMPSPPQQIVNYPMPTYQPPVPMQMYQPPVMPPSVQVPGGYTIVDTTNANWVYSDPSSDPTGMRIRIRAVAYNSLAG